MRAQISLLQNGGWMEELFVLKSFLMHMTQLKISASSRYAKAGDVVLYCTVCSPSCRRHYNHATPKPECWHGWWHGGPGHSLAAAWWSHSSASAAHYDQWWSDSVGSATHYDHRSGGNDTTDPDAAEISGPNSPLPCRHC